MENWQESPYVWYPDGSVVLRAGSTLFCVYHGMLAQKSPVFSDMIAKAKPDEVATYKGLPVLPVLDEPEDLVYFLRTLLDSEYLKSKVLPVLSRSLKVMNLATKYQVTYLRKTVFDVVLRRYCPTTLEEWRVLQKDTIAANTLKGTTLSDYIHIINSARLSNAPLLLPYALFRCCRFIQIADLVSKDALPALALEDRVTLAKAIPHLRDTTRKSLHEFAYFPTRDDINQCNNPVICRALIAKATRASEELMFHCIWRYGALWPSLKCNGICESCLARWQKSYKKGLEAVWEDLPSYFNLPSWEKLRAQSPL